MNKTPRADLIAINAELSQRVAIQNELLQKNEEKYIVFLEKYHSREEKLHAAIRDKDTEIKELRERIEHLEKIPLVNIDDSNAGQLEENRNEHSQFGDGDDGSKDLMDFLN